MTMTTTAEEGGGGGGGGGGSGSGGGGGSACTTDDAPTAALGGSGEQARLFKQFAHVLPAHHRVGAASRQRVVSADNPYTFFSVFKWEIRKGWDVLLKAYWDEFAVDEIEGGVRGGSTCSSDPEFVSSTAFAGAKTGYRFSSGQPQPFPARPLSLPLATSLNCWYKLAVCAHLLSLHAHFFY